MPADRKLSGAAALLFLSSAVVTVIWCGSMAAMPGMDMPGGWVMSMAWMRMPGQTWVGATATFAGMWSVMMVWMMLPVLLPMLARYRRSTGGEAGPRIGRLLMIVAAGYFTVWTLLGLAIFPVGVLAMELAMQVPVFERAVPWLTGLVLLIAGLMQWSPLKQRQLACCRCNGDSPRLRADARTAWRHGLRIGLQCVYCCAAPTAVLLVIGVMDLWAMGVVMAAIALERLAPFGPRWAKVTGGICVLAGVAVFAASSS